MVVVGVVVMSVVRTCRERWATRWWNKTKADKGRGEREAGGGMGGREWLILYLPSRHSHR